MEVKEVNFYGDEVKEVQTAQQIDVDDLLEDHFLGCERMAEFEQANFEDIIGGY